MLWSTKHVKLREGDTYIRTGLVDSVFNNLERFIVTLVCVEVLASRSGPERVLSQFVRLETLFDTCNYPVVDGKSIAALLSILELIVEDQVKLRNFDFAAKGFATIKQAEHEL